ncbi:hypothetical protein BDP27DRAFT_1391015 [Rhodocollybia butyracea]|uniref:L-arabinokinase n=1 Tax=Rhodocollybia butyracea TaxID=206335 RepID=A0A9P5UBU1_9AGAR|nr:hypothetical protein BDP27DRAFT_1391015 [Rhodocollybia butyracea]
MIKMTFLDLTSMNAPCYVYYCSGHGFGHATRVSAFSSALLQLDLPERISIHIVSSAPKHVFADCIGAQYRYADWIDPVIVQPLAYRVDRQKSVQVLKAFLKNKDSFLETERQWLISINARCVLSDAAFLGCIAAKAAGIPSILVTNFTFDSVYSYLGTDFIDEQHSTQLGDTPALAPDIPIPHSTLEPLIAQIHDGYRCADLLLLLPGQIPIPSFSNQLHLPATNWVDSDNRFTPQAIAHLTRLRENPSECTLHEHVPFPPNTALGRNLEPLSRKVLSMPLLVRPPSSSVARSPYTNEGRARILASANVPAELHDPDTTKILVVSFGGQVLSWPRRKQSMSSAHEDRNASRIKPITVAIGLGINLKDTKLNKSRLEVPLETASHVIPLTLPQELRDHRDIDPQATVSPPPPVVNPSGSPVISSPRTSSLQHHLEYKGKENEFQSVTFSPSRLGTERTMPSPLMDIVNMPASPQGAAPTCQLDPDDSIGGVNSRLGNMQVRDDGDLEDEARLPQLLPDSNWIAIREDTSDLPANFYLAPKDVYMPDLTAIADVLLGKLGYGTVAECIDAGTPMVYISRPLFIEELGLRILLENGNGHWVERVKEAWQKARASKERKRRVKGAELSEGVCISEREDEIRRMAKVVVEWVGEWWKDG